MAVDLTALQTEVAASTDAVNAVVALIGQLVAADDPAALQAVVDQVHANTVTLNDTVTANTPAP